MVLPLAPLAPLAGRIALYGAATAFGWYFGTRDYGSSLNLKKPIKTRNGHPVRILTTERICPYGYSVVAAVNLGDLGEVINLYTREGVWGGTLRSFVEQGSDENDLSDLTIAESPVPLPAPPKPVLRDEAPTGWEPLDFSRPLINENGRRAIILSVDRVDPLDNRVVAMVRVTARWSIMFDDGKMLQVDKHVVNVYDQYGMFRDTVVLHRPAVPPEGDNLETRFRREAEAMLGDDTDLSYLD